ncbi:MAG: metallophosphoesterase, partial [Oscillospiraceae bacterium]|nr:metallophosphoesterase [Oscillospiraceae bacterium]
MSDIHGMYEKYLKMLDVIKFSDDDVLYILGDIIDRGPEPIEIILDIMTRPNIVCL